MSRINCHSAFQHYEMFHSRHCGGGNYGSIFNTTYNINCGGHNGGFWGGFGLGLGNAFGNIFGGMFGGGMFGGGMFGGGNMFGGFGFPMFGGGMFGGFPSWGGGWNLSGLFGNREKKADKSDESESSKKELKVVHEDCNDPDLKKINGFRDKVQELQQAPDAAKAEALKKEIEDAMKNQDDTHKAENTAAYQNLLDDLKALSSSKPVEKAPVEEAPVEEAPDGVVKPEELSFIIDGKPVKFSELTNDQIAKMTKEDISKLSPEQAKTLLNNLKLINDDNKVKATTNYQALLLTEKSGLPLACGHNIKLDNVSGADAYIEGTITNVTLNENDNTISFEIEDDNVKLQMSCKADDSKYHIVKMIENKTKKYKEVKTGTEYVIKNDDNDDYAVRNGEAAIK